MGSDFGLDPISHLCYGDTMNKQPWYWKVLSYCLWPFVVAGALILAGFSWWFDRRRAKKVR